MKALYPLRRFNASFDFYLWMVMQEGATEIVFDTRRPKTGRWPLDKVMLRFESICWPGPALMGLKRSLGLEGYQLGPYSHPDVVQKYKSGYRFQRLKTVLPPGNEKYTVTLRKDKRLPNRDSNEPVWREFANFIDARIIQDYEVEPMHLHERMALYAGAEMNFFVTNGPSMLCFLSEYPAMAFDTQKSPPKGVETGGCYPWLLPDRHYQIWEPDELPIIISHFEKWQKSRWV